MRESGVLMHITSLPGPYGIGTMGAKAYEFADFLEAAGQKCWQILPLSPTSYGDSPYQSTSSFAGNPYLIDLDILVEQGLLDQQEIAEVCWCQREDKVDFGLMYQNRWPVLRKAFSRFAGCVEFDEFCRDNRQWLEDFALFMALKDAQGGKPWYLWDKGLKFREKEALLKAREELADEIRFQCFVQYMFFRQWKALRSYVNGKGIRIIGDVPIYVPLDSADVWADPALFQLDEDLMPTAVAGCPPDGFSEDGQLWGNPLYRWDVMESDGFCWWIRRLGAAGKLYDTVRLDHFRGFQDYWAVPYGDATARNGKWIKGPGKKLMGAVKEQLSYLDIIAEDLGFMTQEVLDLRDSSGFPGMKILQFAFYGKKPEPYQPHKYPNNCVCYTGTHDNLTTRQWFEETEADVVDYARRYMGLTREEGYVWGMIRAAFSSVADLAVIPMQDYLELGAEARMNSPGLLSDCNWTWRLKDGIINNTLTKRIRDLTALYDRLGIIDQQ